MPSSLIFLPKLVLLEHIRENLLKRQRNCSKLWETKEKRQLNALGDLGLRPESGENSCQGHNRKKLMTFEYELWFR